MRQFITEHKNDPERVIAFCRKYCEVFNTDNEPIIRNYFVFSDRSYAYPYIRVYSHIDHPQLCRLNEDPEDEYVLFKEVEGEEML